MIFVGNTEKKRLFGRNRYKWDDNISVFKN
jgi:hypothetical protein